MDDLVYRRFTVSGKLEDCLQVPAEASKDNCKVAVEESSTGLNFTLERRGSAFQPAAKDQPEVQKAFPAYNAPVQELLDFLQLKSEFFKIFGSEENPSEMTKKISVVSAESGESTKATFQYLEALVNFISHGSLEPKNEKMKQFLTGTVDVGIRSFADPALGTLLSNKFKELEASPKLGAASRNRLTWLLATFEAREKLWGQMKPEFDKSTTVGNKLKRSSADILTFLFANFIFAENGYKERIFSDRVKEAASTYHEWMLQLDPAFHPSKNFYSYLKSILPKLKETNLPAEYRKDFNQRLDVLVGEYEKEANEEMFRLMEKAPAEKSCKDYLLYHYGDTPIRWEALNLVLKETSVLNELTGPRFTVPMEKISKQIRAWVEAQTSPEKKKDALEAINHLLKALFQPGKMKIYWNRQVVETENFHSRGNFGLVGANRTALENLIRWTRNSALENSVALSPENRPHYPLRKITGALELGLGAAGLGTYFGFSALKEGESKYFAQGSAIIAAGIGLGMAAGNGLSYLLNYNGKGFWLDLAGGVVGGVLAGSLYFATVQKPNDPSPGIVCIGNCTKYPSDVYGQSLPFGFALQGGF